MNILLVRPSKRAKQNFESRVEDMDVTIFACNLNEEVREVLESHKVDMALIFLHRTDADLVWSMGMIMDYKDIRIVGLVENEEEGINTGKNPYKNSIMEFDLFKN